MNCKCKGCEKRYLGCHSTCKDYAEYRKKLDAYNQKVKEEKEKNYPSNQSWAYTHPKKRHRII